MSMFTEAESPLVGMTGFVYLRAEKPPVPDEPGVIVYVGDELEILSAWTRDYLRENAPMLFYVRSTRTGFCTHVTANELVRA